MAQVLFINRDDLVRFTATNGNVDTDRFIQYIFIAQEIHIQNYLGSDLYEALENKIQNGSIGNSGDYYDLLKDYVKPCLVHWAMVEALPFLAIRISNNGVYRPNAENSTTATKEDIDYLVEKERTTAQNFTNRLIDYLQNNASSKFPEYYTNSNGDISPSDKADFGGWQI